MIIFLRRILIIIGIIISVFFLYIYGGSEYELRKASAVEIGLLIETDSASIAKGEHIARTRGCFGCHGQRLEGLVFTDQWDWVKRAVAPNLAAYAKTHTPATIEAAVRQGIGQDGKALYSMPSYNWAHLSDSDVASLIAFLRSAEVVPNELPKPSLGLSARWAIANGKESTMPELVAIVPPLLADAQADSLLSAGQYLAMTACNECHGLDLRGQFRGGRSTPDLAIVSSYSVDEFEHLMKEGKGKGDREIRLMSMVARDRFAHFTEKELNDLRRFLLTLPNRPVPTPVEWRETPLIGQ